MTQEKKIVFITILTEIINNPTEPVVLSQNQIEVVKEYLAELATENNVEKITKILFEIAKITMMAINHYNNT